MKMKALDSFYSTETKQVHAGQEFEIESETRAKDFEDRKLARRVGGEKAAPEPKNKAAPEPPNKAVTSATTKSSKGEK